MSDGWWVFSSRVPTLSHVFEAHTKRANMALGLVKGLPPWETWLGLARPGLAADRHTWIKTALHREDWSVGECNSLCVFILQWHETQAGDSQRGREERQTNRPCTICNHCLSCQIALLSGQRLSVLQSTAMSFQFGEHCRAGKRSK